MFYSHRRKDKQWMIGLHTNKSTIHLKESKRGCTNERRKRIIKVYISGFVVCLSAVDCHGNVWRYNSYPVCIIDDWCIFCCAIGICTRVFISCGEEMNPEQLSGLGADIAVVGTVVSCYGVKS